MRLIVVVRATLVDQMNAACAKVDLDGGDRTFTVPLARPQAPDVPVAYWCSWDLAATRHEVSALRDLLIEHGATTDEVTPVPAGESPPSNRLAAFRADQWTPDEVLAVLGLQRITADL